MPSDYVGRWIAWDHARGRVVASADTYPEIMKHVAALGLSDPVVEKAPGFHPMVLSRTMARLPDESLDLLEDVRRTIPDPEDWLDTPNARLRSKRPRDLIGTNEECQLRFLLRGIRSGITT